MNNNLRSIYAMLEIEEKVLSLFRAKTKIWLEKAQISFPKVENLQAMLLGPSITFLPGKGRVTYNFTALKEPPASLKKKGFPLVLRATSLNSLTIGSPVYYRKIQVGEVTSYRLSKDYKNVEVFISIERKYKKLINLCTKFWMSGGISVNAGLFSGITVRTESFQAFMIGGISFGNPPVSKKNKPKTLLDVSPYQYFTLHEEAESKWLK